MKLFWTPSARADRRSIRAYIAQDNPAAALAMDALFEEKATKLTHYPYMGKEGRVEGTRELVAHRNYILIYDLLGDMVRVVRVMHAARQWPPQQRDA